jgi:hypothetical protein
MAFQISPGVITSELDQTTVVPSVLTTAGAIAGTFAWGPTDKITLIDNEINLVKTFGKPDANSATTFFTAASFLAYGNNLSVVRAVKNTSYNASADGQVQVGNSDVFELSYLNGDNSNEFGAFIARFPGTLGNSLTVDVCANTDTFGTWTHKSLFTSAPGTSDYVSAAGGMEDEMHVVVIDAGGKFTGVAGTVLETFGFVSKAVDATTNGVTNYYKQVIFNNSKYVYAIDPVDYTNSVSTWGEASDTSFYTPATIITTTLSGGTDAVATSLNGAYELFSNKDVVDVSLILTAGAALATQQRAVEIATSRADCIAFISPPSSAVVNQAGSESTNITTWLATLSRPSTYAVADSGWKYMFDKYNNVYRWVPLNGDIAGLCVFTDAVRDPWFSPAGFNRGAIKNCIKLAWNPSKTYRDVLYAVGINPVVSFPGQGTVLYGDKTLQSKPSAFDRINVRRLFITLEKAIAQAAQFSMFELNDEFTRAQFVALVTPFLRDIQGRRGITDFKVVCDSTNNTGQVIDSNQFVGDIYIKPARSVNFIQLNFVAVNTGVDFTTVVGVA